MGSRSQHSSGKSHGAPLTTPEPGGTTRKRPKVGDKDSSYTPEAPRKPSPRKPKRPEVKKDKTPDYPHRDYRGTEGAIDDATGDGRKKK